MARMKTFLDALKADNTHLTSGNIENYRMQLLGTTPGAGAATKGTITTFYGGSIRTQQKLHDFHGLAEDSAEYKLLVEFLVELEAAAKAKEQSAKKGYNPKKGRNKAVVEAALTNMDENTAGK